MKSKLREPQKRARLPILIRYRTQDYETRYLDDPRALYVEAFQEQHRDDGFFAIIPNEAAAAESKEIKASPWWLTLPKLAITLCAFGWSVYRILS